jgi:hypothetical protein
MDACIIKGNAGPNGNGAISAGYGGTLPMPNYFMFDGFELVGPGSSGGPYGWGVNIGPLNGNPGPAPGPHHVWILNSIAHEFSQQGFVACCGEYHYFIHDTAYNTALSTCDAQGSGLDFITETPLSGYTPTADDQVPYSGFGFPTWELGDGTFFHNVMAFNVAYNNRIQGCGAGNVTDGNGIIFDTNSGPGGNYTGDYHNPMLAYGNVTYNNGGGGLHNVSSYNITMANNSSFNNYINPDQNGGSGMLDDLNGGNVENGTQYKNYFYNNIAVYCTSASNVQFAFPGPDALLLAPASLDDPAQGNVTFRVESNNPNCNNEIQPYNSQTYDTTQNKMASNPLWVNVPFTSPGTDATPPGGTNFALSPGSPAIGYGTVLPWMPSSAVDAGACPSALTVCP